MHIKIQYILITLLLVFWGIEAESRTKDYSYYKLSLQEGLSQTTVSTILEDQKGVLWLGTKKGVNVFKQHKLTGYFYDPEDSLSLPNNQVNTLVEDSLGNIWVGSIGGLSLYDKQQDKFIRKYNRNVFASFSSPDGLFFGADNYLIRYNYEDDKLSHYIVNESAGIENVNFRIVDIQQYSSHKLLLSTKERGVLLFDTKTSEFSQLIADSLHLIKSTCIASDRCIYVSTQGDGLYRYSLKGEQLEHFSRDTKGFGTNFILDLLEYKGELWICTDGEGIKILDLKTRELKSLHHVPGDQFSIPTNSITTLYIGSNQYLWAGSVRRGIFCIKESFIKTYGESAMDNPNGLTEAAVTSLYEEENGLLWIGTDGGGLNLFNPKTDKFTHFPTTYGEKIVSIAKLDADELLVSIYTKGMFAFNKRTGKYRPFTIVDEETNYKECFYGYLPMGHTVAPDKIYILGEHCWVYTPSTKKFKEMQNAHNAPFKRTELVLAHSNPEFSLLMNSNKIYYVDQKTDQVSLLLTLAPQKTIVSLAYDQDHVIWVATDQGLGCYDMEKKVYTDVPTKLFDSITFLLYDGKDRLWVGAQSQLFTYEIKDNKFTQINRSDGFLPNEILFAYQNTSKKDYIYLGGSDGLVQICTDIAQNRFESPAIVMEDIVLDGKSVLNKVKEDVLEVSSDYNSLFLRVHIKAEDVFQRSLIKFSIVKNGVWQDFETYNTRLSLPTSLSPGTYQFYAACTTKSGDLTKPVLLAEVVVLPPWYYSNWFLLLSYFTFIGVFSGVVFYSYRKKSKKIRKNMYLYKQHVNEEKINFLINVNHELRTPLTLIYAPLKRIMDKGEGFYDSNFIYKQLSQIYKQAGRMFNIVNMVLDLNRVESGYDEMKMAYHDLNDWVKDKSDDFLNEAMDKNIRLVYDFDESIEKVQFDEWKCQIILSNLLMNAIKFSDPDTTIYVRTQLEKNGFVRVSVCDEGKGLSEHDLLHVFERHYEGDHACKGSGIGLAYSKMLAELHGGRLDAYNNPDKGATFYYEIPQTVMTEPAVREEEQKTVEEVVQVTSETTVDLKKYSVLVVEDTDDLRQFLCETLKETFQTVYAASNGKEALELCLEKDPDIVVSDVMMPVMDGFELCRQIKKNQQISHSIVIMLTARCKEEDEKLGYKLGADFYVKKPFDIEFLQTIIGNLLEKRKQLLEERFAKEVPSPQEITYSQADELFLQRLNKIIEENISNEELNIALVTELMGMSRASLYNKMAKITGFGVNDYINRIRIEKAVYYLVHSNLSIKEISQEVGFSYPRYFSTSFKQVKGMTPTQYKEEYGMQNENTEAND